MENKNWKIVWLIGIVIFAVGVIMSLTIQFQHWDEILSNKQVFMYQIPATCVWVPGWLIMMLGSLKK